MSDAVLPLLLLMFLGRRNGGSTQQPIPAPVWPTPVSPPPMPAFAPQPSATADTATPLTALHHEALAEPAPTAPAPKPAAKRTTPAQAARAAASHARAAATHAATSTAKRAAQRATKGLKGLVHFPSTKKAPRVDMKTAPVADLQAIMIARGAKLSHDGLWGPKTAGAWQTLAMSKGLPADIARVGPKIAKVATQTYDALAVPPIP